jgi:hypothetical protein
MGLWNWFRKKEKEMPKKERKEPVRWTVVDGMKPNRVGPARIFNLRAPFALNIPPGATVKVKLGVSCNYPLHVLEARSLRQRGLRLPDGIWAATDADIDLEVQLENKSGQLQLIEGGEPVARAFILDNNDLEVEE